MMRVFGLAKRGHKNILLSKNNRPEPLTGKTPVATVDRAAQLGIVVWVSKETACGTRLKSTTKHGGTGAAVAATECW